jgi:hypothetical protein
MDEPIRVAFCIVFFGYNGGRFDANGLPIQEDLDEDDLPVRGKCDKPYDCGTCPILSQWVLLLQQRGWEIGWECYTCLPYGITDRSAEKGIELKLPGFYQSGRSPVLRPEDEDFDPDLPPLTGCTHCGYQSSFLQLVLRRRLP